MDHKKLIKECLKNMSLRDTRTPDGFSDNKGDYNYFLDAVRQMWNDLDIDIDTEEVRWIINWFDNKRAMLKLKDLYMSKDAMDEIRKWN